MLRPFPKAVPRKKVGGRKKRYSAILTSTLEKQKIMVEDKYKAKRENYEKKSRKKHGAKSTTSVRKVSLQDNKK